MKKLRQEQGKSVQSGSSTGSINHAPKHLLHIIRAKCLDCCAGSAKEVNLCADGKCSLWPYRMEKNQWHSSGRKRVDLATNDDERPGPAQPPVRASSGDGVS